MIRCSPIIYSYVVCHLQSLLAVVILSKIPHVTKTDELIATFRNIALTRKFRHHNTHVHGCKQLTTISIGM